MAFIPDGRSGSSESVSVELQTESTRAVGIDSSGRDRFVYFSNTPQIIVKTTYRVVGTADDWSGLINDIGAQYQSLDSFPTGVFTESANPNGGWYIIDGEDYYSGTYTEADYSNLTISTPPEEFKIIEKGSVNIQPTGYLPTGEAYYTNSVAGRKFSRSSVALYDMAKDIGIGADNSKYGGYIISKNLSNIRLINDIEYVDLSLEMVELKASVGVTS